jgi:histone H3/H4
MSESEIGLPSTVIKRIVKAKLAEQFLGDDGKPKDVNLSKEALLAFGESAKVFINYLTAMSNDICHESKRQTISAEDVFKALAEMEFEELVAPLKDALQGELARATKWGECCRRPEAASSRPSALPPSAHSALLCDEPAPTSPPVHSVVPTSSPPSNGSSPAGPPATRTALQPSSRAARRRTPRRRRPRSARRRRRGARTSSRWASSEGSARRRAVAAGTAQQHCCSGPTCSHVCAAVIVCLLVCLSVRLVWDYGIMGSATVR